LLKSSFRSPILGIVTMQQHGIYGMSSVPSVRRLH
jgi:hypothetical protein